MDEDVPSDSTVDKIVSLEPTKHRNRILNLQKAARDAVTSHDRLSIISQLLGAYQHLSEAASLQPHEWSVYLALSIRSVTGASGIKLERVRQLFDLHHQSTLHYQSPALFRRYISLVLAYFSACSNVSLPFLSPTQEEAVGSQDGRDWALEFTHVDSCPLVYVDSDAYVLSSLPTLDTAEGPTQFLSAESVRDRLREAYSRCAYQLQESQSIWSMYISFELAILTSGKADKVHQLEVTRQVYLARLRVPHASSADTFQAFSSFVTQHLPSERYEEEMSAASTLFAGARATYQQREQYEDALLASKAQTIHLPGSREDLQVFASLWKRYLSWQHNHYTRAVRAKDRSAAYVELELASSLFERALVLFGMHPPESQRDEVYCYNPSVPALEAHANTWKRLSQQDKDARNEAEQQLLTERLGLAESIWTDYISLLTSGSRPDASRAIEVCARSTRALPTSVQLYGTGMRQLARFHRPGVQVEQLFERAAKQGALHLTQSRFADLCLARLDCERQIATYDLALQHPDTSDLDPATDMGKFTEIYAFTIYAISTIAELGSEDADTSLRLELFAVNWVERAVNALGGPNSEGGASLNELAENIWQTAATHQSTNALVYQHAAAYWTRRFEPRKARSWYKAGITALERYYQARASGELDAAPYEALLQDWMQFEHRFGSIQDVEYAISKIKSARQKIWEAWYAASNAYAQQSTSYQNGDAMTIDENLSGKGKRKASDAPLIDDDMMVGGRASAAQPVAISRSTEPNDPNGEAADSAKRNKTQEAERSPSRDREHCSVLVANMAPETDAAALRSFLRGCGRIVELSGPSILGDSEAAALVEFSDASGASSARTRDQKTLADRRVAIHLGWQCTLFVTNFPEDWEDADVRRLFSVHGTIFTVRWPSKRFVSTRRFCYVQYTSPTAAEHAASALDKQEVAPVRILSVALSDPARRKGRSDAHENTKELFVSGLPRSITEEQLKVPFEEFGTVTGVRLLRAPDGKLRGLGFVDFANSLDAHKAMRELNSTKFRGKTISVVIAENRGVHGAVKVNTTAGRNSDASETTAEQKARSVKLHGLPPDAQEALIQQAIERSLGRGSVKTVYWTPKASGFRHSDSSETLSVGNSAVVEFHDLATAGKAALMQDIQYTGGHVLRISSMDDDTTAAMAVTSPPTVDTKDSNAELMTFVPRASRGRGRGRGRGGLGFLRPSSSVTHDSTGTTPMEEDSLPAPMPSGQDRFREMLKRSQ